jgi:hypothetical protein
VESGNGVVAEVKKMALRSISARSLVLFALPKQKQTYSNEFSKNIQFNLVAGIQGLEPWNARIKIWCLTNLAISLLKTDDP